MDLYPGSSRPPRSHFRKQYAPTTSAAHFGYKAVFGASVWQTALFPAPDKFTSTLSTFLGIWQSSHSWQESEEQLSCCISRLASCCVQGMMKLETMEDKAPLSNWTFHRNKNVTENSFQENQTRFLASVSSLKRCCLVIFSRAAEPSVAPK